MLLVRSKESKNSNKKCPSTPLLTGLSLISLAMFPTAVFAEGSTTSVTSPGTVLSIFLSLMLVIAIIFALAYVMRRFNVAQAGGGQMRVVASMMAGGKEKIMVVQVGDEQHLLGVTSHNINHLAKLDEPLSSTSVNDTHASKLNFQQKLVQAMATGISGGKNKDGSNG